MLAVKRKHEITKIKKKYLFKRGFNLLEALNQLPTAIALYRQLTNDTPRLSEMKKNIVALIDVSQAFSALLRKTKASTKIFIDQTPDRLIKGGYKNIKSPNESWLLSHFETDLTIFNSVCRFAKAQLPADIGGRKTTSVLWYAIFKLAAIYHTGTGQVPTCGWLDSGDDTSSGEHIGDFYKFLLDVMPLLNEINIDLGKKNTIGTYAVEALHHYRRALEESPV